MSAKDSGRWPEPQPLAIPGRFTLPLWPRRGYAVDLHRGLPGQAADTRPGVPRPVMRERVGTTVQPVSTGFELAVLQEAYRHRFLAYAFPSCSPEQRLAAHRR